MKVEIGKIECDNVCLYMGTFQQTYYIVSKDEAIQLAKDLLMACGAKMVVAPAAMTADFLVSYPETASEQSVHSGMSLDEIHSEAREIHARTVAGTMGLDYDVHRLTLLIANLAARVKELNVIQPGNTITCPCGNVFRYNVL